MNRRQFLASASAAALTTLAAPSDQHTNAPAQSFKHRVQFGCWINDMRSDPLPRDNWPSAVDRVATCLTNTIADVDTLCFAKGEQ